MELTRRTLIVGNLKMPVNASLEEAFSVALGYLRKCGIKFHAPNCSVYRRSVDARRKSDIKFVYSISVSAEFNGNISSLPDNVTDLREEKPEIVLGDERLASPPMIVGTGPCGLFAALLLAEQGYKPIVIERGGSIKERNLAKQEFYLHQKLNAETNIQFGAGGAGTYSDGKLVTRINDPLSAFVLDKLIEFGASPDIRFMAKPHVGTDVLSKIVDNILNKIIELGGSVHYNTKLVDFKTLGSSVTRVKTTGGDFEVGALVMAIGHSARDTYSLLLSKGLSIEAKSFSVGMRIEHLTSDIDTAMYGDFAGNALLGHAEYNLSHDTKNRGVYTFCMCPGGEVVAATSEDGGTVVNGMSNSRRDGVNSNSAVVCSVFKDDYGATPEKAITFQRKIEQNAFKAGKTPYYAPIITVGDFLGDTLKHEPSKVMPTYMGGEKVTLTRPSEYLPDFICNSIKGALVAFDKKIEGFASNSAVLTGVETRTSAPVRILRDSATHLALGYSNLYPAGEGAGYAGGITSAAIDGIKTALALIKKFKYSNG